MPRTGATIVWFRQDLRLADHAALSAAVARGAPVIPFHLLEEPAGEWTPGGAQRWWLHQSLGALQAALAARGSTLILRRGTALATLQALIAETGADTVYWSRCYEPGTIRRDSAIKSALAAAGIEAESFNSALLLEPWQVRTKGGTPFQVFTPYWRQCLTQIAPDAPLPAPRSLPAPSQWPTSVPLADLGLLPRIPWHEGMAAAWQPGEAGAARRLQSFLESALAGYDTQRELPAIAGTSRLSPYLHFGEVSPRQVWHAVRNTLEGKDGALLAPEWKLSRFLTEIGWREFAHHLLYHFPHTVDEPLRSKFAGFPWRKDAAALRAWQRGRTGIPLVDAGMRELWHTGWMHNRVRMIAASFLVKNLGIHWLEGARWFQDTLVDADLASNTLGWQWVAGCGADAAPYFRIFNPLTQAEKFDPDGVYVRRWVPEAGTPRYPAPIVDLAHSRREALARLR